MLAYQVLAEVISKLADKLHKAEKCVCFRMHSSICVHVCRKLIIDWGIYLVHALYILDPRVQLCIDEQGSLDFLNVDVDDASLPFWKVLRSVSLVQPRTLNSCTAYLSMLLGWFTIPTEEMHVGVCAHDIAINLFHHFCILKRSDTVCCT